MIGRITGSIFSLVLRLFALAFVWGLTFAILHALHLDSYSRQTGPGLFWTAIVFMIASAFFISNRILRLQIVDSDAPRQQTAVQTQTQMRPSTDSLSMRDLMALLDDDDLDALRGEIRENLSARIQRLSGAEGESFEDLLADAGGKRKRDGR